MASKKIVVKAENGLHARPAGIFVKSASKFNSDVFVETNGKKVNAKSIMGLMSLGIKQNQEVTIITEGADEAAALEELSAVMAEHLE
ncbi:HPr family phosphocarrier protein [Peptostreptococcaceae bacterium AGR-M142]